MNTINGGTRWKERPDGGSNPLERELRANRQAETVAGLCKLLDEHDGLFTIEHPIPSHLWESKHFVTLRMALADRYCQGTFDQCCYGLTLPDFSSV